jgi:hypothetical protein
MSMEHPEMIFLGAVRRLCATMGYILRAVGWALTNYEPGLHFRHEIPDDLLSWRYTTPIPTARQALRCCARLLEGHGCISTQRKGSKTR